jgi:uncharacterized protein (TIGR03086 family)
MDTTLTQYQDAARPLTEVVDSVADDEWSLRSPCEDWTARDVVGHLVQTQRSLLAEHGVDLGPAPDVDADPAAAWRAHLGQVSAALSDDAVPAIAFDGFFGPTTLGETLVRFYVWDMVVHRWDLATAVGTGTSFTDAELDRMESGADGFGDVLYMEGICKPGLDVPAGADRRTRVLARLGRADVEPAGAVR